MSEVKPPEDAPDEEASKDEPKESDAEIVDLIRFKWGSITYQFGIDCYCEFEKNDEIVRKTFANNVWPREVYEHVDDQEYGVRFEYVSQTGGLRHGTISADAFVDKTSGKRAASAAAKIGVDIATDSDHHFAYALGRWKKAKKASVVKIVRTPGWHEDGKVYVNGETIFGDDRWRADEDHISIRRRSGRAGELEDWLDIVSDEVTTPGLRVSLGCSLAGPLIGRLHRQPFITHIFGSSSCGKSTAARVAASVWSAPDEGHDGLFKSWNTTTNALEAMAESADGACIVLDELAKFSGSERSFAGAVHNLASKQGRARLRKDGSERQQRSWAITGLSTGEISMRAKIGDHLQGGQMVRMLDLRIEQGEVTVDAEHAERIAVKLMGAYGVAGDHWSKYLVNLDAVHLDEWLKSWRNKLSKFDDSTAEGGRILTNIALVGAALGAGREAGLVPWTAEEDVECIEWMAERVLGGREGIKTPNERALEQWYTMVDSQPSAFPFEKDTSAAKELFGYSVKELDEYEIWTSERMIKKSGLARKAGISVRTWLQWCVEEGHCRLADNERCANKQRNWKVFPLNKLELTGGDDVPF